VGSVDGCGCIRWGWRSSKRKGSFGGKCGASHCNQWGLCGIVIFCREGWQCSSSQITLGLLVTASIIMTLPEQNCKSDRRGSRILQGWVSNPSERGTGGQVFLGEHIPENFSISYIKMVSFYAFPEIFIDTVTALTTCFEHIFFKKRTP